MEILRDSEVILGYPPSAYREYLARGEARLRVEGGATIKVHRDDDWNASPYYLQGYFVTAGGPHRFVSSSTPSGSEHVIWTSDSDRDFIVRTLLVTTSSCDFKLDGVSISHSAFPFDSMYNNALGMGRGSLVIPAGKNLSLFRSSGVEPCEYFIEGHYIQK